MVLQTISASWRTQSSAASSSNHSEIITMMFSASSSSYLLASKRRTQDLERRHTYPRNCDLVPLKRGIQPPRLSGFRCRLLIQITSLYWKQAHFRPSLLPFVCRERHANALVPFILRISNYFANRRLVRLRAGRLEVLSCLREVVQGKGCRKCCAWIPCRFLIIHDPRDGYKNLEGAAKLAKCEK